MSERPLVALGGHGRINSAPVVGLQRVCELVAAGCPAEAELTRNQIGDPGRRSAPRLASDPRRRALCRRRVASTARLPIERISMPAFRGRMRPPGNEPPILKRVLPAVRSCPATETRGGSTTRSKVYSPAFPLALSGGGGQEELRVPGSGRHRWYDRRPADNVAHRSLVWMERRPINAPPSASLGHHYGGRGE